MTNCKHAITLGISISMQCLIVWRVNKSTDIMEAEWAKEYRATASGAQGHVVRSIPFWGPVKVFLVDDCDRVEAIDSELDLFLAEHSDLNSSWCFGTATTNAVWWPASPEDSKSGSLEVSSFSTRKDTPAETANSVGKDLVDSLGKKTADFLGKHRHWCPPLCLGHGEDGVGDTTAANRIEAETEASRNKTPKKETESVFEELQEAERALFYNLVPQGAQSMIALPLPCNKHEKIVFGSVMYVDRYLSMLMIQEVATDLEDVFDLTKRDLTQDRKHSFLIIQWYVLILLTVKYLSKAVDIVRTSLGFVGNAGARSKFDQKLENVLLHGISSIFCIAMQVTLCTCFLLVWRKKHFLVTFVPILSYHIYFGLFLFSSILNEMDKCLQWSNRMCTYGCNVGFWVSWSLGVVFLTLPLVVTTIFNLQFLFQVLRCNFFDNDYLLVSDEFRSAAWWSSLACCLFILQAFVEQIAFWLHLKDAKKESIPVAPSVHDTRTTYDQLLMID